MCCDRVMYDELGYSEDNDLWEGWWMWDSTDLDLCAGVRLLVNCIYCFIIVFDFLLECDWLFFYDYLFLWSLRLWVEMTFCLFLGGSGGCFTGIFAILV